MSKTIELSLTTSSVQYLHAKDKRLAKVISMVGPIAYTSYEGNEFPFLVHEIIEQMLSVKAGKIIYSRLLDLCNGNMTPTTVYELPEYKIRNIGTSKSKAFYIKNMASAIIDGVISFNDLKHLDDSSVITKLISLKGIGMWTAKMYLIFVLDRPNILPYEDVAFLQAYRWMYKTDDDSPNTVKKKCRKWMPFSSIAARYLYRALDLGLTKNAFHLFKED